MDKIVILLLYYNYIKNGINYLLITNQKEDPYKICDIEKH